jgi:predicted flap endonuclease-1-like 5' DNA nuclease
MPPEPDAPSDEVPTRVLRRPLARDDFQRIDGIGKRLAERLEESGIRTFAQLAALEKKELARVAKQVGVTPERIAREGWLKQARKLKSKPAKRAARTPTRAAASTPKRKASEARSRKRA